MCRRKKEENIVCEAEQTTGRGMQEEVGEVRRARLWDPAMDLDLILYKKG